MGFEIELCHISYVEHLFHVVPSDSSYIYHTRLREVRGILKKKTFTMIGIVLLVTSVVLYTVNVLAEPAQDQTQIGEQSRLRERDPDDCVCTSVCEDCMSDGTGTCEQRQQKLQQQNHHHDGEMPGQHHAHHWYWDGDH
jgi:hypothetical protein